MCQISSKSVQRFARSRNCVKQRLLIKIVNIGHCDPNMKKLETRPPGTLQIKYK